MITDYHNAIVELNHDESEQYRGDETYKNQVIEHAKDLADHTGRVVVVGDYQGYPLDYIDEDGIIGKSE